MCHEIISINTNVAIYDNMMMIITTFLVTQIHKVEKKVKLFNSEKWDIVKKEITFYNIKFT